MTGGLFGFMDMMDNYELRKVARYDDDTIGLMVDTCSVTDGDQPYETAVEHPEYNEGKMVIVEAYGTVEDAQKGHERWVATMTAEKFPAQLTDCCNSEISQMWEGAGADKTFPRREQ